MSMGSINGLDSLGKTLVEITQAAYDLLSEAEKLRPDVIYFITDGTPQALAEDVVYDNTDSGLSANRVQAAIDEVENKRSAMGNPDAFSTANSYAAGDYCLHNNRIYSCVSAVTAGSAFNSSQWIEVTLWDLIHGKKVNLGTISSLPVTKRVSGLPLDFEVLRMYLSNSAAQTGEWDITTAWDATNQKTTITVSGTISGSTTVTLWFVPIEELTAT